MANEKQYKVMQLDIEERKFKVEEKNGYAKTKTANKDRKAKGRSWQGAAARGQGTIKPG